MKGPIQLLLYTAIVGLCAGFAWQIYSLYDFRKEAEATRNATTARYKKKLDQKLANAELRATSGSQGDVDYARPKKLWDAFQAANFFGYVPPKPEEVNPGEREPVEIAKPKQPKVEDLLRLAIAVAGSPENSFLTIQYKPEANVEPPPGFAEGIAAAARSAGGGPRDAVPANNRRSSNRSSRNSRTSNRGRRPSTNRPRTFPGASGAATGEYYHLMRLGDSLWAPHEDVKLVSIDPSGNSATFQREGEDYAEDELQPQPIMRETAGLDQKTLRRLAELGLVELDGDAVVPTAPQPEVQADSGWQDVEQTQIFERDGKKVVNFARKDPVLADAQRIFNEELGTKTIKTRNGTKGVQITRVPSNAASYGVSTGDIIVSINGKPVGSKTEGLKVARSLYDQGRRSFEVEILRNGQRVTQSFVAPDN